MKVTTTEYRDRLGWNLSQKIDHAIGAIEQFYNHLDGRVYISFSVNINQNK